MGLSHATARLLHSYFRGWLSSLDPDVGRSMAAPFVWALVTGNVVCSLLAIQHVPGARAYFALDVVPAFVAFLPALTLGLVIGYLEHRQAETRAVFGLLAIIDVTLFHYFMWALVAMSRGPGAQLLTVFPVLLASFHGQLLRCTPRHPFVAVGVLVGSATAFFLHAPLQQLPLFGVSVPAAVGTSFVVGRIGLNNHRERLRALGLREAIDAQVLSEQMDAAVSVRNVLLRVQTQHHDASNVLSAVLMAAETLALSVADASDRDVVSLRRAAKHMLAELERLRNVHEAVRNTTRSSSHVIELCDLSALVRSVVHELSPVWRRTQISVATIPLELEHLTVPISGGELIMSRVLTNLLKNACEGDGTRHARSVVLSLSAISGPIAEVLVTIEDDGPGFAPSLVDQPLRAFHTTKLHGSGLGLYTCDRLLRASSGRLELGNRVGHAGAYVRIRLPREPL